MQTEVRRLVGRIRPSASAMTVERVALNFFKHVRVGSAVPLMIVGTGGIRYRALSRMCLCSAIVSSRDPLNSVPVARRVLERERPLFFENSTLPLVEVIVT